jgi:hypothetical protein
MEFFLTILLFEFWTTLFQVLFAKNCFNISLVEVQYMQFRKVVFVTTIFDHYNVLSLEKGLITFITTSCIFLCKR